jgi:hypothetical protein
MTRATLASILALAAPLAVAEPVPPHAVTVAWHAQWQGHRLLLSPTLACVHACRRHFELLTLDNPAQVIRQAGHVDLPAATPRELGRLLLAPLRGRCRLRLVLVDAEGRRDVHELDPCASRPEVAGAAAEAAPLP